MLFSGARVSQLGFFFCLMHGHSLRMYCSMLLCIYGQKKWSLIRFVLRSSPWWPISSCSSFRTMCLNLAGNTSRVRCDVVRYSMPCSSNFNLSHSLRKTLDFVLPARHCFDPSRELDCKCLVITLISDVHIIFLCLTNLLF